MDWKIYNEESPLSYSSCWLEDMVNNGSFIGMLVDIEILYPLPSRLKIYMFLSWWGKREEMKYKPKPRAKRAPSYYYFFFDHGVL